MRVVSSWSYLHTVDITMIIMINMDSADNSTIPDKTGSYLLLDNSRILRNRTHLAKAITTEINGVHHR